MQFLAPWFLAGLGLLAVPLLVHLTRRERTRPTPFPSLMFLEHTPHELVRRRRLRDWPLFLLRCLAVLLLAAAFARPFATGAAPVAAPGAGGREVVVLLDRSYSMGAGDRWARATAAARRVVDGLASGDRATLVLFDRAPAVAQAATDDPAALRLALDSARVGAGVTRYTPALALAAQLLGRSSRRAREAVLITDFQRAGWQPDPEARLPEARLAEARFPAGARLTPVDVGGEPPANVAVAGVELRRGAAAGREQVAPVARVTSTHAAAPRDVAVTLEINGHAVERQLVRVPPNGAAAAAFRPVVLPDGAVRGVVRAAAADALAVDDAFHFTASRAAVLRVLVVEGAGARARASLYLRRAFAVGDRPPFRVETRRAAELRAADLAGRDVVVLHDAPAAANAARALVDYVRRGGGLVVALGPASGPGAWPAEAAALLPATPGAVVDRTADGGARLAAADRAHPVFEAFAAPRSGDLSAARVLRYRALGAGDGAAALARFDDGAPALVEHALGAGRVLVWTSTLDGFWNDLALQPVFVPLVHALAAHAARHVDAPAWRVAGEALDLARLTPAGTPEGARWSLATPSGRTVRLGGDRGPSALVLGEVGFYEVRRPDAPAERPGVVAVNVDPAESDLARVEPAEVVRVVQADGAAAGGAGPGAGAPAALTAAEREGQQRTWWYLLAAALALLAGEAVLANRRPGRVRA